MIILDTHVLIWWLQEDGRRLSAVAQEAIDAEQVGGTILLSAITAWEVALLVSKGRLGVGSDIIVWLDKVMAKPFIRFVHIDPAIAIAAVNLPGTLHHDPADRIIVATARHLGATLITADAKLLAYPHVETLAA